jgi:hypothetical protein
LIVPVNAMKCSRARESIHHCDKQGSCNSQKAGAMVDKHKLMPSEKSESADTLTQYFVFASCDSTPLSIRFDVC